MTPVDLGSQSALPGPDEVLAQAAHENFTVASLIVGARRQAHLRAIYGFARLVDDVGDESTGDRGALLDEVESELDRIYAGEPPAHPLMASLGVSVRDCSLPETPFRRLVQANRQDQVVRRYQTFDQLLGYCQLSAAPVGELVLHVFEHATPDRVALSDRVCAGLQVTEHLQDIVEDFARGRVYMPHDDLISCGCDPENPPASSPAARRALVALESRRARALLDSGAPLLRTLPPRARISVAGFVAGGRSALSELERDQDPPTHVGGGRARRRTVAFAGTFLRTVSGR
jgi:squalene synthase HpnC